MFEQLQAQLSEGGARFRVIHHTPVRTSAQAAEVRGTAPGQGAKAMLCRVKEQPDLLLLAVLPGNRKLDFRKLAAVAGGKKATLVSGEEAEQLTGCVPGSIPPFVFNPSIRLVADPWLLENFNEIAFNAGRLDTSMVLDSQDYLRIAKPQLAEISSPNEG